jgi:hypothetical protein
MLKWLVSLFDHRGDARAAAHNDDAAGLVHSIDDVQQPPCPPPPVKRKANCRGAAANAKKLKAVGGGGQFRNTAAMVAAMSLDEQPVLDGGLEPAEAEARSPLRPKRAWYQGLRVDMSHRLSKQAAPLVEPVPRVPAPWVAALDHGGRRDWASMVPERRPTLTMNTKRAGCARTVATRTTRAIANAVLKRYSKIVAEQFNNFESHATKL